MLRQARDWFLREFNPESFAELVTIASGQRNGWFRMVIGYWDMAASLVTTGAVDAGAFRAAHGEIFATFGKIHPCLTELRAASGEADFCKHMEAVVRDASARPVYSLSPTTGRLARAVANGAQITHGCD